MTGTRQAQASVSGRIVALLRLFADGGESLSINEISERLDLAPSSVHRLLSGLVEEKIVERAAGRRYCVGREFVRIGALAARKMSVPRLARPILHDLASKTAETVMLVLLLPRARQLTVADRIESPHPLRHRVPLHSARPLLRGAAGQAVLAWLDIEEVHRLLRSAPGALHPADKPPSLAALEPSLSAVRDAGYAVTHDEVAPGTVDIAAPVFDAGDRVIGGLAVTVPEIRYRAADERRLAGLVVAASHQLSSALGAPARASR